MPVQVSRSAFADMAEILFYIEQRSSQNADVVQAAFEDLLEQLAYVPTLGHTHLEIGDDSIRFAPFKIV